MYLRSVVVEVGSGLAADVVDRIRDEIVGPTSEQPGFFAYYVIDLGDNQVASVRVFEDAESLDAGTAALAPFVSALAEEFAFLDVADYSGEVGTGLAYARLWL